MRLSFDGFDIDPEAGQLFRAGSEVPLERRAVDMLCYLAAHPGRLITKDELLSEVWRARTLSDGVLSNTVAKLRKALGQATGAKEPIETVRGRGYRWHAVRLSGVHAHNAHAVHDAANEQLLELRADPFVGRVPVMEVLERSLEHAVQGNGQLVLLVGDAGIGKTRTLDEFAQRARTRGFSVWAGAAYDGAGAPPYWPWVEILRSAHADLSRAMFRRHLAVDSWAMSLLVPELVGVAPTAVNADAQATRFRLFDEVARFIASASSDAPCLIMADDLHWADDGTLELLVYLTRALKKRAVVLAATLREHDTAQSDARTATLQRLGRQATQVALAGLSLTEVEELVGALRDSRVHAEPIHAQLRDALYQRTQGNPFFVRQTLELLAQRGQPLDAAVLDGMPLPQAVRDVLRQRIHALGRESLGVLRMAAAVGMEFDAGLLADVLTRPLADVLAAIEPACRKGVVVSHATLPHRFGFGHALLRDSIYDELPLAERGALHARLAHVLQARPAGDDARHLGEIARHFLLGVPSELELCVRHCQNAADAARNTLGFETAADILSRASEKLASEGGDDRTRCELMLALGMDRFRVGDFRSAWSTLRQGAAIAEQINATDLFARFACRLAAWLELGGGDEVETRQLIDRALRTLGDDESDLRAALLAHRAEIHFELSADERNALLDAADGLAARRNTPLILLEVAIGRASLRDPTRLDDTRAAIAAYRELVRRHANEMPAAQRLLSSFAVELAEYLCALTSCDLDAADGSIQRCRWLAQETQVVAVALGVDLMQAGRALGDGRLDELAASVQSLSEASSQVGGFGLVWQSYAVRLLEAHGGLTSMTGFGSELPAGFEQLRPSQRMNGTLWLARMHAKTGGYDIARRLLASIPSEQLARMPVRYGDLGMLCFLAEIYEALQDRVAAAALYQQLQPYAALNAVGPAFEYAGSVAHYLGLLARLLGRDVVAAQHFEHAVTINRQLRMPLALARSQACVGGLTTQSA